MNAEGFMTLNAVRPIVEVVLKGEIVDIPSSVFHENMCFDFPTNTIGFDSIEVFLSESVTSNKF